jgi:hypothetical protein
LAQRDACRKKNERENISRGGHTKVLRPVIGLSWPAIWSPLALNSAAPGRSDEGLEVRSFPERFTALDTAHGWLHLCHRKQNGVIARPIRPKRALKPQESSDVATMAASKTSSGRTFAC